MVLSRTITCVGLLLSAAIAKRDMYVYVDDWTGITPTQLGDTFKELADNGATYILNFVYMPGQGETRDSSAVWAQAPTNVKQDVVNYLHSKGSHLLLVAGGGTLYYNDYINQNPQQWAAKICGHAKDNLYDGVDFDLENLPQNAGSGFINFAKAATEECRKYVNHITHAPQSPYFESSWGNVYDQLVPVVDQLLVQFYNQGPSRHISYDTLFGTGDPAALGSLWQRFPNYKNKFVVGKYIQAAYGGSAMLAPNMLQQYATKAEKEMGYTAGLMIWRAPQKYAEPGAYSEFLGYLKMLSEGASSNSGGNDRTEPSVNTNPPVNTQPPSSGSGDSNYDECKRVFQHDAYCSSLCDWSKNNPATCSYYGITSFADCIAYLMPDYCKVPQDPQANARMCREGLAPSGNAATDATCGQYCDALADPTIFEAYCKEFGDYGLGMVKFCLRKLYGAWCSIV